MPCMSEGAESSCESNGPGCLTPSHAVQCSTYFFHARPRMHLSLLLIFFFSGILLLLCRVGRHLPGKSTGP